LRGRLTFFDVVTPGSELRLDAGVGRPSRAAAEWYLALGNRGLFVAPRASYLRDQQGFMLDGRVVAEYRFDTYEAAADAGLSLGHDFELRAGYARERVSSQLRVGDPILPEFTGAQSYWRARAVFDGQSNPVVPDHGLYLRGELRRFTETAKVADPEVLVSFREPDQLTIGEVRASYFKSAGRHGRIFAAGGGGWTFRDHTILNAFSLGGPLELSALQQNELRGSNYVLANAGYLHEVARLLEGAAGRLYVGGWVENGTVFEHVDDAQVRTNFSAGLIMETIIGPAFFVGSLGTDGRSRVYVGLGQVFRH
jgi:NTE family protein